PLVLTVTVTAPSALVAVAAICFRRSWASAARRVISAISGIPGEAVSGAFTMTSATLEQVCRSEALNRFSVPASTRVIFLRTPHGEPFAIPLPYDPGCHRCRVEHAMLRVTY